jgi:hypothetical protein
MPICSPLVGIPKDCGDNNLGSIKEALIASFEDVLDVVNANGLVSSVVMAVGTQFQKFEFRKDTSRMGQEWTGDLVADTHSYSQTVELGFRRFDTVKRNALMLLAAGRRDLVVICLDTNGEYWMLGSDQGMRLSGDTDDTGTTRSNGQQTTVTLTSENERYKWLKVTTSLIPALLTPAPAPDPID